MRIQICVAILLSALGLTSASVVAHQSHPARPAPSQLQHGLNIDLQHPRVLRSAAAFSVSIVIENLTREDPVIVEAVRVTLPGGRREDEMPGVQLESQRDNYHHLRQIERELDRSATRTEQAALSAVIGRRAVLLAQLHAARYEQRVQVEAYEVPPAGTIFTITVQIDVADASGNQTVQRSIEIPVAAPLPGRGAAGDTWFAGDQHLHTTYSLDAAVLDGTSDNVADYAAVAHVGGLAWITATDHSNIDFQVLFLEWYTPEQFAAGAAEAAEYSAENDFLALNGQEMGTGQGAILGMPSHYLAYPGSSDSTGFLDNPCSGYVLNVAFCEDYQVIIDRVASAGGIGFIAHPADTDVLYVPWDFDAGAVGWSGMEIWTGAGYSESDEAAYALWHDLLGEVARPRNGQLMPRAGFPNAFPVGIGNSDAHVANLVGATFTYIQTPEVTRANVTTALLAGNAVVSNGPLLHAHINGAGIGGIAPDITAGVVAQATLESTPEFGPPGDYEITVLVNGEIRAVIPPDGSTGSTRVIDLPDLALALPDKFVTLRAASSDGNWRAFTNPIWLQFPICIGDVDDDGTVGPADAMSVLQHQGPCAVCPQDINADGIVDSDDFMLVVGNVGSCNS